MARLACVLSLSDFFRDSRVRRQCQVLRDLGYDVQGVGYSSARRADDPFEMVEIPRPVPSPPSGRAIAGRARTALRLVLTRTPLRQRAARSQYWSVPVHRAMREAAATVEADLFVANDWNTLAIAAELARERGAAFCYDSHEYAVEQSHGSWRFRLFHAPFRRAIENGYIHQAAEVFTVSDGISLCLKRDYRLARAPIVVRNTPAYVQVPFRLSESGLTVLYHGGIRPGRGLDDLIRSIGLWRPDFRLLIRGTAPPDYQQYLRALADAVCGEAGLDRSRIAFAPAVPVDQVVAEANLADIGISLLPDTGSRQIQYALPNKFFEYVMAGLALCVPDLPAMRELVARHDLGVTMARQDPAGIAAAINGLDHERVARFRRNALVAAQELCWERESEQLSAAFAAINGARGRK